MTATHAQNTVNSTVARPPIRLGLVGLGGYARGLLGLIRSATPEVELVAGCDPDLRRNAEAVEDLRDAGGAVFDGLDAMLDAHASGRTPLDAVWLPVPIHLHRSFAERCLAAGLAVMVEKPAAGSLGDLDAMIAARDAAQRPVLVGFQDLYFAENHAAKQRLGDGGIGDVRRVCVVAGWPRSDAYYGRNDWAGALQRDGVWVRDSPLNNALAHPVHLVLFMLGSTPQTSARVAKLDAELYRANPIASFDTCTVRFQTDTGVEVMVCLTHACATQAGPITTYLGDTGSLTATHSKLIWDRPGFDPETISIGRDMTRLPRCFAAAIHGLASDQLPPATLDTARAHTELIERLHQSVPIQDVPARHIEILSSRDENTRTLPGIEAALDACAKQGKLLSELSATQGGLA